MKTRGGGWTVLQHRSNGSIDFHRSWNDYKTGWPDGALIGSKGNFMSPLTDSGFLGFGVASGEHWLGNDIIHKLTSLQEYSLHIQLRDREGNEAFSQYDHFYIDDEDNNY
ncbi:hypothetical protein AMECASPLE_025205, partial [Ameca splendens]